MMIDYVSSTTTTTDYSTDGEPRKHHHRRNITLLPETGKQHRQFNKKQGAPPPHSITPVPGGAGGSSSVNITQKKTRIPGVPPGEPQPIGGGGAPISKQVVTPDIGTLNTIITGGAPYPHGKTEVRLPRAAGHRAISSGCSRAGANASCGPAQPSDGVPVPTDMGLTPAQIAVIGGDVSVRLARTPHAPPS